MDRAEILHERARHVPIAAGRLEAALLQQFMGFIQDVLEPARG